MVNKLLALHKNTELVLIQDKHCKSDQMKWLSLEMQNMIQKEKSGSVNIQQSHISSLSMSGIEISPISTKNCQRDTG
jgi:predicted XRE-type DNA-binding protein